MDKNDSFEKQLAEGWQEYGFLTPDEMIEARRAYGGIRDDLNPILRMRGRRVQTQSSGSGGFFLGAILGYFLGRDRQ